MQIRHNRGHGKLVQSPMASRQLKGKVVEKRSPPSCLARCRVRVACREDRFEGGSAGYGIRKCLEYIKGMVGRL